MVIKVCRLYQHEDRHCSHHHNLTYNVLTSGYCSLMKGTQDLTKTNDIDQTAKREIIEDHSYPSGATHVLLQRLLFKIL